MFATGILAHYFLLPFISILVQVFVVNVCFSKPELAAASISVDHHVVVTKVVGMANAKGAVAAYHFSDYYPADADSQRQELLAQPGGGGWRYPADEFIVDSRYGNSAALRAPPVL